MKQAITLCLALTFSIAACTAPTEPLPAVEAAPVQVESAAQGTDCHNEPNSSDDCNHNEPDG